MACKGIWINVVLLALASISRADVVTLTPVKDNSLFQISTGSLSNGSGQYLFAGRTAQSSDASRRRALVSFDIAGSIPAGSTITSVSVTLNMSRTAGGSSGVALHRVFADWGEGASNASGEEGTGAGAAPGDATWLHTFFDTDTWVTPGGDFEPTFSERIIVAGLGSYTWPSTALLIADVQAWLDQPTDNFGWIVIGSELATLTAKRFDSREHPDPSRRPVLTIQFTPPAMDPCCLPNGMCALLTAIDCMSAGGTSPGASAACEGDADNDGIDEECGDDCPLDPDKTVAGLCGCGVADTDSDNDGTPNCIDGCPNDSNKTEPGVCGCGNDENADSDNDTVPDCVDQCSGVDDLVFAPGCVDAIPTQSTWGMVILTLMLLTAGKIRFG